MLIFTKKSELLIKLQNLKKQGLTLGFVPTMGALHEGHLSLIRAANALAQITVCSVFVNPTQFNDKADLDRYPRMPEKDTALLESANCDLLFMPSVDEMYPPEEKQSIDLGHLNHILEAAHRPGHFDGVAQIVSKLFQTVQPDFAFFGSKDFQQVLVVRQLVKVLQLPVTIIACPIMREADGLAMSSRNALLSKEERQVAALIPQIMKEVAQVITEKSIAEIKRIVSKRIQAFQICKLDYFEIADAETLEVLSSLKKDVPAVALIALFVGKIRLIDNLQLQL